MNIVIACLLLELNQLQIISLKKVLRQIGIAHKGYGKRKPLASNQTAAGRRRNQRVELRVLTL